MSNPHQMSTWANNLANLGNLSPILIRSRAANTRILFPFDCPHVLVCQRMHRLFVKECPFPMHVRREHHRVASVISVLACGRIACSAKNAPSPCMYVASHHRVFTCMGKGVHACDVHAWLCVAAHLLDSVQIIGLANGKFPKVPKS
jgi:hypothetical protein